MHGVSTDHCVNRNQRFNALNMNEIMSEKFKNKYRIKSVRLQSWDYANIAAYFITVCTKNRKHYFGEIADEEMHLNEIGNITEQEWIKTPELRPDMNLELGEFVVMPNHFHGIIIIGENHYNTKSETLNDPDTERGDDTGINALRRDAIHGISTNDMNVTTNINDIKNKFGPQSKNLGSIIRGFKSSVTTHAKKIGIPDFAWQPRFHDHIIRDAKSFELIQNYIASNPKNWKEDKFFS